MKKPHFTLLRNIVFVCGVTALGLSAQPLATVQISAPPKGAIVPKDFIGLSIQQSVALNFFGPSTSANNVLFTLMKNLGQGSLRIGGNAADYSCWNGEPAPAPSYCQYTLTGADFDSWSYASGQTGWPMILGVNLVQNLAPGAPQYILDQVTKGIQPSLAKHPRASLLGLELGNEINLYALNLYRPAGYGFAGEATDLLSYIGALKGNAATQSIPLVAPAYYNPSQNTIVAQLDPLMANVLQCPTCSSSNIGLVTLHEYPLSVANGTGTIAQLLAPSLIQQNEATFHKAVTDMQSMFKLSVQLDETNSTIPDPGQTGVSDVQASALWALDYILDMARIGIKRMNFHMHLGSYYNPIVVTNLGVAGYSNQVEPEYYAMYAALAAKGKQFSTVTVTSPANIRAYALSTCATCALTVYIINKDLSAFGSVQVNVPYHTTSATYYELSAPALNSPAANVTLGGSQFSNATGLISGPPQTIPVSPDANGNYTVNLDYAAAGILTITP